MTRDEAQQAEEQLVAIGRGRVQIVEHRSEWKPTVSHCGANRSVSPSCQHSDPMRRLRMHTTLTTKETLEFYWHNYQTLIEQVDLDFMPYEQLQVLMERRAQVRPFRIMAWTARQGAFISMWSLWEFYARGVLDRLPVKIKRSSNESTVTWIDRSLNANGIDFKDRDWFAGGNCLRNLIAHCGCRVDGPDTEKLLDRSKTAFPNVESWQDGYVVLTHEQLAELILKIEDFIELTK
jgi:hypothetical protein